MAQLLFFPNSFVRFQEHNSRPQQVILKRVTFKSTGTYRCEVTAIVRTGKGFGISGFVMRESINKMVVVGMNKCVPILLLDIFVK